MVEEMKIEKRLEQDILTVRCPCCGELIPVRINLAGLGVNEGYVQIGGCNGTDKNTPFPDIEIEIKLDVMGLKYEGGLDEIIENAGDETKRDLRRSYEYDKSHGVYTDTILVEQP